MFGLYFSEYLFKSGIVKEVIPAHIQTLSFAKYTEELSAFTKMSETDIEGLIKDYQQDAKLSDADMSALKSDDIDRIIPLLIYFDASEDIEKDLMAYKNHSNISDDEMSELVKQGVTHKLIPDYVRLDPVHANYFVSLFLKMLFRYTGEVLVRKARLVPIYDFKHIVYQRMRGSQNYLTGFSGDSCALVQIASAYAGMPLTNFDEYATDCVGELINCINGMFASDMSNKDIYLEIDVPLNYSGRRLISNGPIVLLPIDLNGKEVELVISVNADVEVV